MKRAVPPCKSYSSASFSRAALLFTLVCLLVLLSPSAISSSPTPETLQGGLGVFVRGSRLLTPGTAAALRIATHLAPSEAVANPVGNVAVSVTLSGGGKRQLLSSGTTDAGGGLDARFVVPQWPQGKYEVEVRAEFGPQIAVEKQTVDLAAAARILLESDKPLYQPGQTVHMRALTMRSQDGHPLNSGTIRFVVTDPRKNRIFQSEKPLSAFGIASTDLPLADELLLGSYHIQAELVSRPDVSAAEPAERNVEVSRYVLPKIRVSVRAEQSYTEPGKAVKFSVAANYFHGKPVSGGQVTAKAYLNAASGHLELATLHGKLDELGALSLSVPVPADSTSDNAKLIISATVEDAASQRAESRQELPIAKQPIIVDVVPEAGQLVPQVENQVSVLVARPDGAPVEKAAVSLVVGGAGSTPLAAITSAIGIAQFSLPRLPVNAAGTDQKGCPAASVAVKATVTIPGASAVTLSQCLSVRSEGGLLLRSDRAVYARGDKLTLSVQSAAVQDGLCFIDVVRDKQLQDTLVVPLRNFRGQIAVPLQDRMAGTVSLLAYVVGPDGRKMRDARLVYVERPSALRVLAEASSTNGPAGAPLHPGQSARLRLRVVDADSGVGVKAALGLVMVDEALLALRPLRPGLLRAYFSLGQAAKRAAAERQIAAGGMGIEALVEKGGLSALEQDAAKLLLAGAVAPWDDGWESDPWAGRARALTEQKRKWADALSHYEKGRTIGERVPNEPGKWRYRQDLPSLIHKSGFLTSAQLLDPWRRPLQTDVLIEAAGFPAFDEYAQRLLDERLTTFYRVLWNKLEADLKTGKRQKESDGTVIFSDADIGNLPGVVLLDPWGTQMRVQTRKKPHKIGHLLSKVVLYSAGPDGVFGSKDDLYPSDNTCYHHSCRLSDRDITVVGVSAAQAFSDSKLGCGCGYGAAGGALAGFHRGTVAYARLSEAEGAAVGARKDSVRSSFPETLLYRPEVITNEKGEAEVPLELADSITTWRLLAEAVAQDGRLGSLVMGIPVVKDFFVDLDLPPVVTQHDELAIPVPMYNHLKVGQNVVVTLQQESWFAPLGPLTDTVNIPAGQAAVRYFRIRVLGVGKHTLRLFAQGSAASDAVERPIEVVPDGIEQVVSVQDRLSAQSVQHSVHVPAMMIPSTSEAVLKLYPSPASHVVEGLDSLLRMPHGCFEQTSSTTYPNALILRYLRRARKTTPAIEQKALEYLQTGYQKLLSFEVAGGGFSWFGSAPAHKILTAYGIEEFADMAEVFPVDAKVIERTQKWLASQQQSDGSFVPDRNGIREGAINAVVDDKLRTTAYIALALKRTDRSGVHRRVVDHAREFAAGALRDPKVLEQVSEDPYTLALLIDLLGPSYIPPSAKRPAERPLWEKLWALRKQNEDGRAVYFASVHATPTYGSGKSGVIETTALAASQFHSASLPSQSSSALAYLISAKDSFGTWHSTQATIRSLKALLEQQSGDGTATSGVLDVYWDGQKHSSLTLVAKEEGLRIVALPPPPPGAHQLSLQYAGKGVFDYQLVTRYYVPRGQSASPPQPASNRAIGISIQTSSLALRRNETLVQTVVLESSQSHMMPLAQVGIPPGFSVEKESLDRLVTSGAIEKYELTPRYVSLYLSALDAGARKVIPIAMTALLPGKVQIPAASVYPYYEPETRSAAAPSVITVQE